MEQLVREGKVLYAGSSNFAGWDIATAQGEATTRPFMGLVSEQSLYNLAVRTVELEVIPAARHHGLGLLCWSPLMRGMLAGTVPDSGGGTIDPLRQLMTERHRTRLETYEAFCRELGEQPADVALGWLLHNPVVTAPIIGPRTLEQLRASLRALELTLSDETLSRLDEIWPGPGGEAPQAYAW
jgi:aryl-alcohol dehydrogenase-like predicted oxidoreductase